MNLFVSFAIGPCHSTSIFLGYDLRICTFRKLCGLWWLRQHLLHLQPENTWGECTCESWACRTYRYMIYVMLLFLSCVFSLVVASFLKHRQKKCAELLQVILMMHNCTNIEFRLLLFNFILMNSCNSMTQDTCPVVAFLMTTRLLQALEIPLGT